MLKLNGQHQAHDVYSTRDLVVTSKLMGVRQLTLTLLIAKLDLQPAAQLFHYSSWQKTITRNEQAVLDYAQIREESTKALTASLEALKACSLALAANQLRIHL